MSVLECGRNGCENVMCDIIIDGGYVCGECAKEFVVRMGNVTLPEFEMVAAFRKFLSIEKVCGCSDPITPADFVKRAALVEYPRREGGWWSSSTRSS